MGIIIILFVCVYSGCPPRRRNEQGQVRWGNISRLHGGTGRKKLKRRRKKDRERILLDKKKGGKTKRGKEREKENKRISAISHPPWQRPHPILASTSFEPNHRTPFTPSLLLLSLSLSHSLLPLSVHQPRAGWIRQASTREGGYIPLYRSCLFTMRRVYPS